MKTDYLYFDSSGKHLDVQQHVDPVEAYAAGRQLAIQHQTDVAVTVSAFTFKVVPETLAQPNKWYRDQIWRQPGSDTAERAGHIRRALADLVLYPAVPMEVDSGLAVLEANQRAALHDIVDELDRVDLAALFQLARLLVLFPRQDEIFAYVQRLDEVVLGEISAGN